MHASGAARRDSRGRNRGEGENGGRIQLRNRLVGLRPCSSLAISRNPPNRRASPIASTTPRVPSSVPTTFAGRVPRRCEFHLSRSLRDRLCKHAEHSLGREDDRQTAGTPASHGAIIIARDCDRLPCCEGRAALHDSPCEGAKPTGVSYEAVSVNGTTATSPITWPGESSEVLARTARAVRRCRAGDDSGHRSRVDTEVRVLRA